MLPKTLALKDQGFFYLILKNKPSNFAYRGGLFQNRYDHKGQVKFSLYTQYVSVFENIIKPLFVRVTAFWVNILSIVNIVNIYKKYSFFIVFLSEKRKILKYRGK